VTQKFLQQILNALCVGGSVLDMGSLPADVKVDALPADLKMGRP